MLEAPRIISTQAQQTAVIRFTIPRPDIQKVMGPAIQEVIATVTAQGVGPAGPVFSHHFRMDPHVWDFEVGVPVSGPVTPTGRVQPSLLPALDDVVQSAWVGPYESLGEGWGALMDWIIAEGMRPDVGLWESYVRGPESNGDPSTFRTELFRPLAR